MTKTEKLKLIQDVIDHDKSTDALIDKFQDLFGNQVGEAGDIIFSLMDKYVKVTSKLIGDEHEWLAWFIYDNECGANGFEAGESGKEKPVKTVEDLLELIEG